MKKVFSLLIAGTVLLLLCSCQYVYTSDGASLVPQVEATHPGYEAVFTHQPKRVEGNAEINVLFGLFAWGEEGLADYSHLSLLSFLPSAENFAKSAAVYNACQTNRVDALVGTRYIVKVTDYLVFKRLKSKVTGYPAAMTGIIQKSPYVVIGKDGSSQLLWLARKPTVLK